MGGWIRRGWIWRFWGAPIFRPEVPKYLFFKGLGTSGGKIGAPQKRQIQPQRIQPPILGPLFLTWKKSFLGQKVTFRVTFKSLWGDPESHFLVTFELFRIFRGFGGS